MGYPYGMQGAPAVGRGAPGLPQRQSAQRGEILLTKVGTYTITLPDGVDSICAACVGGGGNASGAYNSVNLKSGGGGALAWKNNIKASKNNTISVKVAGPTQSSYVMVDGVIVCEAGGGGTLTAGTVIVGDGGGSGGEGIESGSFYARASGGGAGGYSGSGANGVQAQNSSSASGASAPSGGGGGSGACYGTGSGSSNAVGGSGGVGLFGEGASGTGGLVNLISNGGKAGSANVVPAYSTQYGGTDGGNVLSTGQRPGSAGLYGAGGGGVINATSYVYYESGAQGAVRIIWGEGRAFPSKDVRV